MKEYQGNTIADVAESRLVTDDDGQYGIVRKHTDGSKYYAWIDPINMLDDELDNAAIVIDYHDVAVMG